MGILSKVVCYSFQIAFWIHRENGMKTEEERTFALTPYQGKKLDNTFSDLLKELKNESNPEEVVGLLFRHGLMSYKIAMVLSVL